MSEVGSISAAATATTASSSKSRVSKEDFLQLLVKQLSNQDPLNPTDNQEFTAQLAQLESLEVNQNMNETLTSILQQQGLFSAASMLGLKTKAVTDNGVIEGTVQGVSNQDGGTVFNVDGQDVDADEIQEILW